MIGGSFVAEITTTTTKTRARCCKTSFIWWRWNCCLILLRGLGTNGLYPKQICSRKTLLWRHGCCWLGLGSLSIGDPSKNNCVGVSEVYKTKLLHDSWRRFFFAVQILATLSKHASKSRCNLQLYSNIRLKVLQHWPALWRHDKMLLLLFINCCRSIFRRHKMEMQKQKPARVTFEQKCYVNVNVF